MKPDQLDRILNGPTDHSVRPITHSDYKKFEALVKLAPAFLELWKASKIVLNISSTSNMLALQDVIKKLEECE